MRPQCVKVPLLPDGAQYIEGSVPSHEQVMPSASERVTSRTEVGTPAVVCPELGERRDESINVARIAGMNNVEIERGNRSALDDRGDAPDEHEAHAVAKQRRQDRSEVSRPSGHG